MSARGTQGEGRARGEKEVEGGSEGNSGLLYSASSDPGYGPMGDPGMNGGEGAGGTKTGDRARGGGTSMGKRERGVGNRRRTSSTSAPSMFATCSSII